MADRHAPCACSHLRPCAALLLTHSGSPYTLAQAQSTLLASPVFSGRLAFEHGDAGQALSRYPVAHFQTAVLAHSLWYFSSEDAVKATLMALRKAGVQCIALAEWSWSVSRLEAVPHLLAALTQTLVPDDEANIRLPLSPAHIKQLAVEAGWTVAHEELLPSPTLKDGVWEVGSARAMGKPAAPTPSVALQRHLDALETCFDGRLSPSNVQTMDVWAAVLA